MGKGFLRWSLHNQCPVAQQVADRRIDLRERDPDLCPGLSLTPPVSGVAAMKDGARWRVGGPG